MTFEELGLPEFLVEATERLEWSTPTPIQTITIPKALEGKVGMNVIFTDNHTVYVEPKLPDRKG